MTSRARGVVAVVLALLVALPLLPTALDDDSEPDARTDDDVAADDVAPDDDGPDDDGPDDADGDDTSADDDSPDDDGPDDDVPDDDAPDDDGPDDDGPDATTPTDPTTTAGTNGSGTPSTDPPARPATVAVDAIGDLVAGRRGMLSVALTAASTAGGVVTLTVRLDEAGWAVVPDSCTRSAVTAVCTFALDAGERLLLLFELDVDAEALAVEVSADAVIAGGPDPSGVAVSIPTADAAGGLAAKFSRTGFLDVAVVGNTLASCADGATVGSVTCANVRAGTATSSRTNDAWAMAAVRADARPAGSASGADLDLGGETVTRAFLVWGASTTTSTPATAGTLRFATPVTAAGATPDSDADYIEVSADELLEVDGGWQSTADVTSLVAAAGSGRYWGADIAADLGGTDAWAGWSLVVVHSSPTPSDVIVLAGLVDLRLAGTRTPVFTSASSVTPHVSVVMWDGDAGSVGERLQLEEADGDVVDVVDLGDALNPAGDVGNSTVSRSGVAVTARQPAYVDTLGVDLDRIDSAPIESSDLVLVASSASGDDVLLGVVAFTLDR